MAQNVLHGPGVSEKPHCCDRNACQTQHKGERLLNTEISTCSRNPTDCGTVGRQRVAAEPCQESCSSYVRQKVKKKQEEVTAGYSQTQGTQCEVP